MISSILRERGYWVTVASTGREALAELSRRSFDVVLMDLEMPDMDGYEASAAIRRLEHSRSGVPMPIIALTAHALDEVQQKCLHAGMEAFLPKPVDVGRLLAQLETATCPRRGTLSGDANGSDKSDSHPSEAADAIIDMAATMQRLGGDAALFGRCAAVFDEDAPKLVATLRAAAAAGDLAAVRRAAHSLRGLAATFNARSLVEIASHWEHRNAGDPHEAAGLLERLAEEVARVREALSACQRG
jgi:CheY-like chemotaxis protein